MASRGDFTAFGVVCQSMCAVPAICPCTGRTAGTARHTLRRSVSAVKPAFAVIDAIASVCEAFTLVRERHPHRGLPHLRDGPCLPVHDPISQGRESRAIPGRFTSCKR
ncbi:MAG: hypothetical protein NFCOHLIN_00854 [Gammaproteobacteria bacterium]|nr:hypothetical protein [Gammaproteobacteria bacterium]